MEWNLSISIFHSGSSTLLLWICMDRIKYLSFVLMLQLPECDVGAGSYPQDESRLACILLLSD